MLEFSSHLTRVFEGVTEEGAIVQHGSAEVASDRECG